MTATHTRRGAHFTREHQRKARAAVSSESCAANGRKGAQVTIERYGYEFLFQRCRRFRLLNPSSNELLMIGILARMSLTHEREWRIGTSYYTVDFKLSGLAKVIEVNGRIHSQFDQQKRKDRAARKAEMLAAMGIDLLVIDWTELADVMAVAERIRQFARSGKGEA